MRLIKILFTLCLSISAFGADRFSVSGSVGGAFKRDPFIAKPSLGANFGYNVTGKDQVFVRYGYTFDHDATKWHLGTKHNLCKRDRFTFAVAGSAGVDIKNETGVVKPSFTVGPVVSYSLPHHMSVSFSPTFNKVINGRPCYASVGMSIGKSF